MPTYSTEEIEQIGSVVAKNLSPLIRTMIQEINELPPLLTREQFMEYCNIGSTKANELFNRADFPVTRQLGHPRVYTKKLFEWIEEDIENRRELNINYPYKVI